MPAPKRKEPSNDTIKFLMDELAKKGGFNQDSSGRSLVMQAAEDMGAERHYPMSGDTKFVPGAYKDQDYAGLAANAKKSGFFADQAAFDQAVAQAYGADVLTDEIRAAALAEAKAHQGILQSAWKGTGKATYAAMGTAGEMLVGDAPVPDQLFQVMGITEDKLRAKYGNAQADGFKAEVATLLQSGKVNEAMTLIGMTEEHVKTVVPSTAKAGFDVPLLKDMPPWGQAAAIGGVGAGAGALAYHLMAQGQQQQSSADYNAMAQAMAAY